MEKCMTIVSTKYPVYLHTETQNNLLSKEQAEEIIKKAKAKDKYFVYDLEYCMFKPQMWCDHNIFGFYPSHKCIVYCLDKLKEELSQL